MCPARSAAPSCGAAPSDPPRRPARSRRSWAKADAGDSALSTSGGNSPKAAWPQRGPKKVHPAGEKFPRASLEIIEAKSWSIHEWILTGRIDIGILYDPRPSSLIEVIPLEDEAIYLVSAAANPPLPKSRIVRPRDLGKYPLILPSFPHAMRALVEAAATEAGARLNVVLQMEGAHFILELVRQGHGCTTLPVHVVQESRFANKLQLNVISQPRLTRQLTIAVPLQRPTTRLARETIKLIQYYLGGKSEFASR